LAAVSVRGYTVRANQRCELCSQLLFSRQFQLFPCGHGFHDDCLLKKAPQFLADASQVAMVKSLEEQIKVISIRAKDSDKRALIQLDHLQNELDNLISSDCLLCGEFMIRSVGMSLILPCDEIEAKSWEL
jgi:hypothetical protein